ncbi:hypothetical protein [Catenuloplanes japonicus]|uniref:hypothetical protein n=1 Tax=Catenuloplanes japonicus TaxID=33876 RepID=UPI00068E2875|nr:hypothetical protein [Catenuloplanes japonicus]
MAIRTWGRVLLTSLGVSIMAGAGQLGIAYGFGLVRFGRAFTGGVENQWNAQLTWVAWCAVTAAVAGALVADRAARRLGHDGGPLALAGIAVASSAGAATVALITMPAARTAILTADADPVSAVGTVALLGAAAGLPLAALALWQRAYAWTLTPVATAAWLLAVGSAAPSFGPGDALQPIRLGVLDPAALSTGTVQRLAVVVMPSLALIAGATVGAIARRREHHPVIVATTGLLGPAPFAAAYLIAGPGTAADAYQAAPYWGALVAVAAGALGSMLALVVPRSGEATPQDQDQTPSPVRPEPSTPSAPSPSRPPAVSGLPTAPQTSTTSGPTGPAGAAGPAGASAASRSARSSGASSTSGPARASGASSAPVPARDSEAAGPASASQPSSTARSARTSGASSASAPDRASEAAGPASTSKPSTAPRPARTSGRSGTSGTSDIPVPSDASGSSGPAATAGPARASGGATASGRSGQGSPRAGAADAEPTGTGTPGSPRRAPARGRRTRSGADAIPDPVRREPSDTGPEAHDTARTSADPPDPRTPISSIGSTGTDNPVSTEISATSGKPDSPEKEGR